MTIYLYIKQCNHCDLKYFGRTMQSDPYYYNGSGVYWSRHLKEHNQIYKNKPKTLKLWEFETDTECSKFAERFSIENDITKSKSWANLCDETGHGRPKGIAAWNKGKPHSKAHIENLKKNHRGHTGHNHTSDSKAKIGAALSIAHKGKPWSDARRKAYRDRFKAC